MQLTNKRGKGAVTTIYAITFLLILACNLLTPYVVDDFRYVYSFYDGEPVNSLWDIVMSMRVHRYHMNGRIAAHSLVQLFALFPNWIFDIVNALMYVLQIGLLYRIARWSHAHTPIVLISLVCGAWLWCPAFGQVNLWQDGACNYLWSGVFALLYLGPFIDAYLNGRTLKGLIPKCIFLCIAFFMGAYSETVSAAAIFMSMLLVLLIFLENKQLRKPLWFGAIAMAFLGYLFIYTAPAQWREKGAEMKLTVLIGNFFTVAQHYWALLHALLILFCILLVLNLIRKTEKKRILLALVFFAGSLAANFIMMFASYYTTRSGIGAFVFLLGAVGILLYPLALRVECRSAAVLLTALILVLTMPAFFSGTRDIYSTFVGIQENEQYLLNCKEEGILDVQLPVVDTQTKYSAINGLKYLDVETSDIWPNKYMATYYGVNSILGVELPG